jgi:zinc transport system substrate-binding protein
LSACLLLLPPIVAVAQERPVVVTVNYPLQYMAEQLLGEAAEVVFPVPEGVDPSFWRPGISDISMIQSADLILLNGAGFATWVDRVSLPRARIVNTSAGIEGSFIATESITHSHGDGGEHSHEGVASYLWLDPSLAMLQAEAIAEAATARGLSPSDDVETRLESLRTELEAMDAVARDALAPAQGLSMIATHPRYQYLARAYGLSIASLEWDAGAMPSDEDLADLQALIQETGARILIWEREPPAAAMDATSELGVENTVFNPLSVAEAGSSFTEAFTSAVDDLSQTVSRVLGN